MGGLTTILWLALLATWAAAYAQQRALPDEEWQRAQPVSRKDRRKPVALR